MPRNRAWNGDQGVWLGEKERSKKNLTKETLSLAIVSAGTHLQPDPTVNSGAWMVPLVPTLTKELHAFAILHQVIIGWGFPGGSDSKESACSVGDLGLIPGSETDLSFHRNLFSSLPSPFKNLSYFCATANRIPIYNFTESKLCSVLLPYSWLLFST